MRPMRERNQITVGIVGTAIVGLIVLLSVSLGSIPFLNPTDTYYANFASADGLKSGDDVRVEGIKVGEVQSVKVQGDHVHVEFTVKQGLKLGNASDASIEVATVLGNLFMQVESAGAGTLETGSTIPIQRTTVPYSIITALQTFAGFSNDTKLPTLRSSLDTLAQTISGISPSAATDALNGLANMAQTFASKQNEITQILDAADKITTTLNSQSSALVDILVQGDDFLKLIEQRRDLISSLLRDTASLGNQIQTLLHNDGPQLSALLSNLKSVTAVLAKQKTQLQRAVLNLGQFSVNIANATGSGPWIDLYTPTAIIPDNVIKNCGTSPQTHKKPCT